MVFWSRWPPREINVIWRIINVSPRIINVSPRINNDFWRDKYLGYWSSGPRGFLVKMAEKEWLVGLVDGDGCFLVSKKHYTSLEITMDLSDKSALCSIKIWTEPRCRLIVYLVIYRIWIKVNQQVTNLYLNNYTQSAGNLCNIYSTSTSETTRMKSSNIKYNNSINNNWLTWFIGFIEGDGCFTAYNNNLIE